MIAVDTDIIIWALRGKEEIVAEMERAIYTASGNLFVTPIQLAEIYAGLRRKEEKKTATFLSMFGVMELTAETGIRAGSYLNRYKKSHGVCLADALICAAAVEHGHKIWTLNRKHYPMLGEDGFW